MARWSEEDRRAHIFEVAGSNSGILMSKATLNTFFDEHPVEIRDVLCYDKEKCVGNVKYGQHGFFY